MLINRLDFHISYICLNRCIFCSEKNRLARFSGLNLAPEEIKKVLTEKRKQGFEYVTFTGGEPTLSNNLSFALKLAKLLGYRTCTTTNGYGFSDEKYCKAILPYCDEIMISVHGSSAEMHDSLTGRKGSFEIFRKAMRNIYNEYACGGKKNLFLMTNTVLTDCNASGIADMYRMLAEMPHLRQCLLSNPAPEGGAYRHYAGLELPPDYAAAIAGDAATIISGAGKIMRFFGFPACRLGKYAEYSNDFYWSPRLTVERGIVNGAAALRETVSERPTRRRHYEKQCISCQHYGKCGGFFDIPGSRTSPGKDI